MSVLAGAIVALTVALAAANGSNDNAKGVANLAGAGVTRYRSAVVWGTVATLAGSFASLSVAHAMTKLFSKGIVAGRPSDTFALAVLVGAAAWVAAAIVLRLPVSTTHALIGALVGAGVVSSPDAVQWHALVAKLAAPLLLSVAAAYGLSFALSLLPGRPPTCVCVELLDPAVAAAGVSGRAGTSAMRFASPGHTGGALQLRTGAPVDCAAHRPGPRRMAVTVNGLHWLSSGAASFARGLNDTPKIVAVGAFALVPTGMSSGQILAMVALAMAAGGLLAGMGVARRLGDDIVTMSHVEGLKANVTTAVLVGAGATRGLPMSTTQVSAAAIAGAAGSAAGRINRRSAHDFLLAWTATPLTAGLAAGAIYALIR